MNHPLRIAVVGCGMLAQSMHLPNILRHPDLALAWCCDTDPTALEAARARFSPEAVTADAAEVARDPSCDAVVLATTQAVRLPLIDLFARAGKHIFVEKPMAGDFDELEGVLRVVRETGVRMQVGHNRRVAPAVRQTIEVLEKHRRNPVSPEWRWNREGPDRPPLEGKEQTMVLLRINDDFWSWKKWAFEYGALVNEMTHFADLACCFIPSRPTRVSTGGGTKSNHVVTVEFADGSLATIFASAFGSFGYPKELVEIYTRGAAIVLDHLVEMRVAGIVDEPFRRVFPLIGDRHPEIPADGIEGYYQRVQAAQREAIKQGDNSILPGQPDKGHYALLDDFVRSIRTGAEPACSAETAAVPTAIVFRAIESAHSGGRWVDI